MWKFHEHRKRHDDAHRPFGGRGARAIRTRGNLRVSLGPKAVLHVMPPQELCIPATRWQWLMLSARRKFQAGRDLGYGVAEARKRAIELLRQERVAASVVSAIRYRRLNAQFAAAAASREYAASDLARMGSVLRDLAQEHRAAFGVSING